MLQWHQNTLPGFYPPLLPSHDTDTFMHLVQPAIYSIASQFLHYDRSQNTVLRVDLKERCLVYSCTFIHCMHDTFNMHEASYQFGRGPCAADHVINSSRPSPSVFSSLHLVIFVQCARRGGERRPGNEATKYNVTTKLTCAPRVNKLSPLHICTKFVL